MDGTVGSSALNRYICPLEGGIDCRSRSLWVENLKLRNQKRFCFRLGTSEATGKWMISLDSAHQTGVSTLLRGVLIIDEGICR